MSFTPRTFQRLVIGFILTTSFGILIHDTHLDQATSVALALPAALIGFEMGTIPKLGIDDHTHEERVSLSQAVRDLHEGAPQMQPRDDHRKYVVRRAASRSGQPFGDYVLPMV